MKKVLYFDTWTRGLENYLYFDELLKKKYQTMLVHMESVVVPYFAPDVDISWYTAEKEQVISGILCKDVSAYNDMKIVDILKQEAPDVVVMLAFSHLQNRIVTVACKHLGIKVIFLMHGLIHDPDNSKFLAQGLTKTNRFKFLLKFRKFFKYIMLLNEYRAASGSLVDTLDIAFQVLSSPHYFSWCPKKHYSLDVDKILVYLRSDISSISTTYKIAPSKCVATGNPKLDITLKYMVQNGNDNKHGSRFLYIEGSLNGVGILSDKQQSELLSYLKSVADQNNMEFAIRLHPRANRKLFIKKFGSDYIFTAEGETLRDSLLNSKVVAGQGSTALLEAIAYRIPTISLEWNLEEVPMVVAIKDDLGIVRDRNMLLGKLKEFNTHGWLQEKTREHLFPCGEVPASKRIVAEIEALDI